MKETCISINHEMLMVKQDDDDDELHFVSINIFQAQKFGVYSSMSTFIHSQKISCSTASETVCDNLSAAWMVDYKENGGRLSRKPLTTT